MKKLIFQCVLLTAIIFIGSSCKKDKGSASPPPAPPDPPVQPVLLKDINISNLPSPYYHFEYNTAGKPGFVSFASGFLMYDITYSEGKISEMKTNIIVNKDRLQYSYDNAGRVDTIRYADSIGIVYKRIYFTYNGQKLIKLERERVSGTSFIMEKTMTFLYYADGNLSEFKDHRNAMNGQAEFTFVERFEQYDNKTNVDDFSLLHNEFFDHLVFLPGVRLQNNNPGKLIRTGDGFNYRVNYTYTYNNKNLPLIKRGDAVITTGPDAGKQFQSTSVFSYY